MNKNAVATNKQLMFIMEGGESYGVRRVWDTLVKELSARGYLITVVTLKPDRDIAIAWKGYVDAFISIPSPTPALSFTNPVLKARDLIVRGFSQLVAANRLAAEIRRRGRPLLILQSPLITLLVALAAALAGTTSFWLLPNSVNTKYPLDINRRIYRTLFRSGSLVPVSNSRYTDSTLGIGAYERHVVHLGIDPLVFDPGRGALDVSRRDLGIGMDAPLFGLFARMVEEKGHLPLLRAFATIDPGAHLMICGGPTDGAFGSAVKALIKELELDGRVHLLGAKSDVRSYYALCDVVLNTRIDPEPFGLSVIEAMSMGRPVLAHAAGGPSETILDGRTGWLVPHPTVADFIAGLNRALADRDLWVEMGAAAAAHVRANFTEERMIDDLEKVLASRSSTLPNVAAALGMQHDRSSL